MSDTLPTHCAWCGAYLMGGATQHAPTCWLAELRRDWPNIHSDALRQTMRKFESGEWLIADECTCRTPGCGHPASSHIGGTCFECGREGCWS